ncbi:MAG TPA: hypothetical protein VHC22_08245 [Pirellulales bacterium]|nr:hypothetical protein [Pirellulales bacterium]
MSAAFSLPPDARARINMLEAFLARRNERKPAKATASQDNGSADRSESNPPATASA